MMRMMILLAALASCDSDEWCTLTGNWSGSWTSHTSVTGTLASTLSQHGPDVTGTVSFTSSPCFNAADVMLVQAGEHVSGSATAGGIQVDLDASWVEDHLEGTYNAISAGACTGDTGTFVLDRK